VISACAELARRLIRGQPPQEKKTTMLSWVSTSEPKEYKGKDKEGSKPLVVVGFFYAVFIIYQGETNIPSSVPIPSARRG